MNPATERDNVASRPAVYSPEDFAWQPLQVAGDARIRTVLHPGNSDVIGAGFVRFRDISFEWDLPYEEILYLIEGELEVEAANADPIRAGAGDVMLLPRGNRVVYHFRGDCLGFFSTWPVNWEELSDGA